MRVAQLCTNLQLGAHRAPALSYLFYTLIWFLDMKKYFNCVLAENGEGIMLRKALSCYEPGKSASLLKVKVRRVLGRRNRKKKYTSLGDMKN